MNMEMRVGYKLSMIVGVMLMAVLLFMCLSVTGCGTLGNGQNDLPYDIAVTYVSPTTGIVYTAVLDDDGLTLTGTFTTPDGGVFEISKDGPIIAADGKGNVITLTPKG